MEYREIFLTLLRKYDETRQPLSYLKDLVESTHLFLRMLERFCKGRKNLMVQVRPWIQCFGCTIAISANIKWWCLIPLQKKKRRKRSHGAKKSSASEVNPQSLEETWKIVAEELKACDFQVYIRISLNPCCNLQTDFQINLRKNISKIPN